MASALEARSKDTFIRLLVWGGLAALLTVPAIAMRFTDAVQWTAFDFLVVGGLFALVGAGVELALRLSASWSYRIGFGVALMTGFLTVWVNLAVGMIGNEENPANLVFLGVLLVSVVGAIAARFRADGMAWAMVATAVAQAGAALYAATLGETRDGFFIAGFCVLWLVAAGAFRLACCQVDGSSASAKGR